MYYLIHLSTLTKGLNVNYCNCYFCTLLKNLCGFRDIQLIFLEKFPFISPPLTPFTSAFSSLPYPNLPIFPSLPTPFLLISEASMKYHRIQLQLKWLGHMRRRKQNVIFLFFLCALLMPLVPTSPFTRICALSIFLPVADGPHIMTKPK